MRRTAHNSISQDQLSLFDHNPRRTVTFGFQETNSKIEWSYYRRQLMNQCPLAYYNRYYGASRRTAQTEPLKEELRFFGDNQSDCPGRLALM